MIICSLCFECCLRETSSTEYTAKLLFHQSPMLHSDYTVTGQWQCSYCWQLPAIWWLPAVVNGDYTVTIQSPCFTVQHRWLMEQEFCSVWHTNVPVQDESGFDILALDCLLRRNRMTNPNLAAFFVQGRGRGLWELGFAQCEFHMIWIQKIEVLGEENVNATTASMKSIWSCSIVLIEKHLLETLRGYCTPNLKLACFVCYRKIINTVLKNNACIIK